MMDFITVPITVGIVTFAFYKLFELFVRKKERLMIIEKMSSLENVSCESFDFSKILGESRIAKSQYISLRIGSLLVGLGMGLLVGYGISFSVGGGIPNLNEYNYHTRQSIEIVYGASALLFGGLGLVIGFIIENKMKSAQ